MGKFQSYHGGLVQSGFATFGKGVQLTRGSPMVGTE